MRFSHDGKWLGFIDHRTFGDDLGRVAIIPAAGGEKKLLGPEWGSIQGIAWSRDDTEIWFTAGNVGLRRSLHAVSIGGAVRPLFSVPGGLMVQDHAPAGHLLVNHGMERRMLMVLAAGSDVQRDLTWLDWPIGLGFSADGKQLLFTEQGAGGGPGYSVYLRGVDGSPAVRLGDGDAIALSPDDKWAVSRRKTTPTQFMLLPTGAGDVRQLTHTPVEHISAGWFPDGKRLAFVGTEGAGHQPRTFLLDLDGNEKPLTPEGLIGTLVAPDGLSVLVRHTSTSEWQLFPVDGRASRPVPVRVDDIPLRFTPDGGGLYVATRQSLRFQFLQIHLQTGRREHLQNLGPADPVGVAIVSAPAISPDGQSYGYQYRRTLSTLYVIDGLK